MPSVDNRVVAMKFDNAQFQQKMQATIFGLQKLQQSLQLPKASQGLQNVNAAASKVNLAPLNQAAEGTGSRFSAMATVAMAAIASITHRAIGAGIQITKALTIAPIAQGFGEFELKMGAIQTIMSGSGESLETVNQKLNELNEYADRTIYSFSDMTQNIGKFTNAGVDLETSVDAIQGIANAAALSGANSGEASRAMYNFSQALSQGNVKLRDWMSIENANMATMEFKQQMIDTAVEMGTLTEAADGTYKALDGTAVSAMTFRDSLQSGWFTSDVLTTGLGKFSDETTEIGKRATAAAQDVKTFSQMVSTMKESVGSGWAMTFEHIFGDFEEGKFLWTSINNVFENTIGKASQARNDLLEGWKALGGRNLLLESLANAFSALQSVVAPIKEAFRDIFPPMTVNRLVLLTESLRDFTAKLKIGEGTAGKVKRVFSGVFSVIKIGIEVIKGIAGVIGGLIGGLAGVAGTPALDFFANLGDRLVSLRETLVDGGGIAAFFENIKNTLQTVIPQAVAFIQDFGSAMAALFSGGREQVGERAEQVVGVAARIGKIYEWLADKLEELIPKFDRAREFVGSIFRYIRDFMGDFADKLAAGFEGDGFNALFDLINVGLIGGLILALGRLRKVFAGGLGINLTGMGGGLMQTIQGTFGQLTATLGAMQAELKANALLKIAGAVAILTASVLVLSLIDSKKLTAALVALSVGFGQLIAAFALMNKLGMGAQAAKMVVMAGAMMLLAGAAVVLSLAITVLSRLSWSELAKGLAGVAGALAIMVTAMRYITTDTSGLIKAAVAMGVMALSIRLLANAVRAFGEMDWQVMVQGLGGVAAGLILMVVALNKMPEKQMLKNGLALIFIAGAMRLLAFAVTAFGQMGLATMGQGLLGIAGSLAVMTVALNAMKTKGLLKKAAALLAISVAMNIMALAVRQFASMGLVDLAKGIGAIAVMLAILAVATNKMSSALLGAAAIVVVAGALLILTRVLTELAKLSIGQLITGIVAMAAVFLVIGVAALLMMKILPAVLALGAVLITVGAGFALIGLAAFMFAKALEIVARVGAGAGAALRTMFVAAIQMLPALIAAVVTGLINMVGQIADAAPELVESFVTIVTALLDGIIEMMPKFAELMGALIDEATTLIKDKAPGLIEAGMVLISALLDGIDENIGEFTERVMSIITTFIETIAANIQPLIDAGSELLVQFLYGIASHTGEIVEAGVNILISLLQGLGSQIGRIQTAAANLLIQFLAGITGNILRVVEAGGNLLMALIWGIGSKIIEVANAAVQVLVNFITAIGNGATLLAAAGTNALVKFVGGITSNVRKVVEAVTKLIATFITTVANSATLLVNSGANAIIKFVSGISSNASRVAEGAAKAGMTFIRKIGDLAIKFARAGADVVIKFLNGLADAIDEKGDELRRAGVRIAEAIVNGMTGGLAEKARGVADKAVDVATGAVNAVRGALHMNSPSRVFQEIGEGMAEGMVLALDSDTTVNRSAADFGNNIVNSFRGTISRISDVLGEMDDLQPVIAPVLDLSQVERDARHISSMMGLSSITPDVSYDTARLLSHTSTRTAEEAAAVQASGPSEVKFEQNIYSPKALTTHDIYRQTKSQIALAKEELGIS